MTPSLESLEQKRSEVLKAMESLGDMRRGSVVETYLPCGKPSCCCKQHGHRGHGPYFTYSRKVDGKTQTKHYRPGPVLTKVQREVDTFHRFRKLSEQLIEINEQICQLRPVEVEEQKQELKKTLPPTSTKRSAKKSKGSSREP